jgi:hypothetical protein
MVKFDNMNKKLLKLCLCACAALGLNACDTGEYNDLKCDASYVAECLSGNVYMTCNNGTLDLVYCDGDQVCMPNEAGARCVPRGSSSPTCIPSCSLDGTVLTECVDGNPVYTTCANIQEGFVCRDNRCQAPLPACEISCSEDGTVLHNCLNGDPIDITCADQGEGFVCINNECKLPQTCTPSCSEDGTILHSCLDDDSTLDVICADEGEGFVCINNECKLPPACESTCDEEDSDILHQCNALGETEEVRCSDKGEDYVCHENACRRTCDEDVCADDGINLFECDGGFLREDPYDCSDEDSICDRGTCIEPSSVVGMPCSCEGSDCDYVYTGAELKSLMTERGNEVFAEYLDKIDDDEMIVGPNFFSENNVGCEALQEILPDGMTAACFRSAKVEIPAAFTNLIAEDFVNILDGYLKDASNQSFIDFAAALDNLQFTAKSGYCMPVVLDIHAEVKNAAAKAWDNEKLAADGAIFGKINTGDHEAAKAGAADPDYCPENSSFFSYELNKRASSLGSLTINFDLCLQNCDDDTDCRDGYNCMDLDAYGRVSGEPTSKVCFDEANQDYFISLKAALAQMAETLKK